MSTTRKVQRVLTEAEIAVLQEAIGYCEKGSIPITHWNVNRMLYQYFPGRGKTLSQLDVKLYILSKPSENGE